MALSAQKFREAVFQILFSQEFDQTASSDTALMIMGELRITKRAALQAHERSQQVRVHLTEIDAHIRSLSQAYEFDRISSAEKCALRLGCFEVLYDDGKVPPKVAIAEAIRLTRKFGTPSGAHFVNAILDALYKNAVKE